MNKTEMVEAILEKSVDEKMAKYEAEQKAIQEKEESKFKMGDVIE